MMLILVVGGLAAALPAALLAVLAVRALPSWRWWGPVVTLVVLVLDLLFRRTGHPRPIAVNRQVPRHWGHDLGPWWAAVRYAPRLGFGPGTILPSWAWWGMLACGAAAGWRWALVTSAMFVCARTLLTMLVGSGITDGVAMAGRLARVATFENRARLGSVACTCAGLLAGSLWLLR